MANNTAFILTQKKDPDSKIYPLRKFENRAKYRYFLPVHSVVSKRSIFAVFGIFFTILLPVSFAQAGILSFMSGIFSDLHFSKEFTSPTVNSQTMSLLEAVKNTDPSPDLDKKDVTIVNGSAILTSSTPDQSVGNGTVPSGDQVSVYVVHKGDNLSAIAKMFGVSINTILWANDIPKGRGVTPGQKLVILPVSGVQYTIKKGDTIANLASVYKADADEIRGANNFEADDGLVVGDTIILPNGIEPETPSINPIKTIKKALSSFIDSSPTVSTNGYFIRPTAGRKTQGIHGHNGIDFHADKGTVVVAAAAGTVVVSKNSGWNGGYGQYIVIKHSNGTQTLYAHLSANIVSEGQEVSQGQLIAYSGATGKSEGPHLHFEVRGGRNPF